MTTTGLNGNRWSAEYDSEELSELERAAAAHDKAFAQLEREQEELDYKRRRLDDSATWIEQRGKQIVAEIKREEATR